MISILKTRAQIEDARRAMQEAGESFSDMHVFRRRLYSRILRTLYRCPAPIPFDINKSWDVRMAADAISRHRANLGETVRPFRVLDLGTLNSELPLVLCKRRIGQVFGVDLDPRVVWQHILCPRARFFVQDMVDTKFPDTYFDAITAISVVEHGFAPVFLLREVTRLLKPGGLFVFSTDYWEPKVDIVAGLRPFGMTWRIFCRSEIEAFLEVTAQVGLTSDADRDFDVQEAPIQWMGYSFTYLYGELRFAKGS